MAQAGALATVDIPTILARYHQEPISQIAKSLGVSDVAIYLHVLKHNPEGWKDHQAAKALHELEQADRTLQEAPDALSLGRGREALRSAQWKLERVLKRIYGQDTVPTSSVPVQITINLRSAQTVSDLRQVTD